eukprot:jgi/Mesen1/2931/ME000175S02086
MFLVHEKHSEDVPAVIQKFTDFVEEARGKVWRLSNWGLRPLAYRIQKASSAVYVLMNVELPADRVDEFKLVVQRDERVIRELVKRMKDADSSDYPAPPLWRDVPDYVSDDDDEEEEDDEEEGEGEEEEEEEYEPARASPSPRRN